jgi:HAD superfamily hydrolase (TIGR01509 family)
MVLALPWSDNVATGCSRRRHTVAAYNRQAFLAVGRHGVTAFEINRGMSSAHVGIVVRRVDVVETGMTTSEIRWVLFDMGNVLVRYEPCAMEAVAKFYGIKVDDIADVFFNEGIAQHVSEGGYSPEEFVDFMNVRFKGNATRADYVTWYTREIDQVLPGIDDLVAGLEGNVGLAVLSNTFFGHWDYFLTTPLASRFNHVMASHELGVTKPDPACYERALLRVGASPEETLFLDDKIENVTGASRVGIQAFQSLSVDDTRRVLVQAGLM